MNRTIPRRVMPDGRVDGAEAGTSNTWNAIVC